MVCNYRRSDFLDVDMYFINNSSDVYLLNTKVKNGMNTIGTTEPSLIGREINIPWSVSVPKELLPGDTLVLRFYPTFELPLLENIFDGYIFHLTYINDMGLGKYNEHYRFSPVRLK